jgi:hypothetical protein
LVEARLLENDALLAQLLNLVEALEIQIRYESLEEGETSFFAGGLCRIGDRSVFFLNAKATKAEQIRALARGLGRFDLSQVYLKPAVRDLLEDSRQNKDEGPMKRGSEDSGGG